MQLSEFSLRNWESGHRQPSDRLYPSLITYLGEDPWDEPATLGERLQAERRRRGLSIDRAAALLSVDEGTWARWESGEWKPQRRAREALGAFLGAHETLAD